MGVTTGISATHVHDHVGYGTRRTDPGEGCGDSRHQGIDPGRLVDQIKILGPVFSVGLYTSYFCA